MLQRTFKASRIMAVACTLLSLPCFGQAEDDTTRFVPEGTVAVISAWPKAMAAKEKMQYAPLEVLSASGLEQFGFDPLVFERVDVIIGMPIPAPVFGVLIQSSEAIDLSNIPQEMVAAVDEDSGMVRLYGPEQIVVRNITKTVAVLGTEPFVDMMLKERSGEPSKLHRTLDTIRGPQDVMAIVDVKAIEQVMAAVLQNAPPGAMPPQLQQGMLGVLKESDILAVRVEVSEQEKIQMVLASPDEGATQRLAKHINSLLAFGRDSVVAEAQQNMDGGSATDVAMQQYIARISKVIVEALQPRQIGNRLVVEVDQLQSVSVIGTLTGLMLPALQSARGAARRMQSSNNLKQLALAMHNFESAYRSFPTTNSNDDDGKPLLSWRVAILPFIEQTELYNRFHLDEPWDSEHNLALLEEMPDTYRHPGKATKPGHTVYQAPVGEHTLLRKDEPTRFGDITDGTSNTIMLIETHPDNAVPWTAPQDWEVDHDEPNKAEIFFNQITQAAFGDGSVHVLAEGIDLEVFKALLTRDGGEVARVP